MTPLTMHLFPVLRYFILLKFKGILLRTLSWNPLCVVLLTPIEDF
jgi:hypothetical protein